VGRPSQQQAEPLSTAASHEVRTHNQDAVLSPHVGQGHSAEDAAIRNVQIAYDRLKQEPIPDRLLALALRLR
jgi:hypothetical protein